MLEERELEPKNNEISPSSNDYVWRWGFALSIGMRGDVQESSGDVLESRGAVLKSSGGRSESRDPGPKSRDLNVKNLITNSRYKALHKKERLFSVAICSIL